MKKLDIEIKGIREKIEREKVEKIREYQQMHCSHYDSGWCLLYKEPCNGQCEESEGSG